MRDETEERARVVRVAREWLDAKTPYHHASAIKGVGVDCGQFIAAVFTEAELIERPVISAYPRDWMLHRNEEKFLAILEEYTRRVDRVARPGDILLFRYGRTLSHGAIVLDSELMIHSLVHHGVTLGALKQEPGSRRKLGGVWTLHGWT